MSYSKKHINNIIAANNDNRLAIFVGAGASKSSENFMIKIPTWMELIGNLKSDLELSKEENDYLKIAQLYYLEFGEFIYYEKLKSFFPNNIEPSLIHKLIFDINPQCVITTNWDNILEKTIESNAFIYDVVSSDEDLIKSTLQKKLIKMHGDFKNHNIVLKEDDYLSYKYNFPIIENFIKSIISTHSVLFIGYSYNDVNLKQIMKWLQNHSKFSPPRYLISFHESITQEKYLKNHNITVLTLKDEDENFKKLDIYSKKLATFLNLIVNPKKALIHINENDEIVEYIYNKLRILHNFEGLLLEQIRISLTNCGFIYTDNSILLEFYSDIMTTDFNVEERVIHGKFINLLKSYDLDVYKHKDIEKILSILIKANIDGIVISNEIDSGSKEYIDLRKHIVNQHIKGIVEACLNFEFSDGEKNYDIKELSNLAYQNYQIQNYENAYNILEEIIALCLKQRNYTQLFLTMFNRNLILKYLKFNFTTKDREKYLNTNEYDLKERLDNLPRDLQKALEPIYSFLNFDFFYRQAFNVSQELERNEDEKRIIENGGIVYNNNITESASKHRNLILFVLHNNIMIEDYLEYKTINKNFIKISILKQSQSNNIKINKLELYSCIKYFESKELKILFKDYCLKDSKRILLSNDDIDWLAKTVVINLGNLFINSKELFSKNENFLSNAIFLLSLVDIEKDILDKVVAMFLKIISEAKNTIAIYDSINQFLGIQHNLFKTNIDVDVLLNLIEIIVNKFIYKKYNIYDFEAITSNTINNIYAYAREKNAIFNNDGLVTRLLIEVKDLTHKKKLRISQSLLLKLYDISNENIQKNIREYVLSIDTQHNYKDGENLVFELLLFIRGIKDIDDNTTNGITEYLEEFNGIEKFSSIIYSLNDQFKYLVEIKENANFIKLMEKTKEIISNHEKNSLLFNFY